MSENGKAKFHPRNKCLSTIVCYTIYKFTAAQKVRSQNFLSKC